jgi:hypothetical protein
MKFLVFARARKNQQGMSSAMLQATLEKVRARMKAGIIDCLFSFTDGSGTVGISNAESSEAMMHELHLAYPASPFVHFEVLPIFGGYITSKTIATMERQGVIRAMKGTVACNADPVL